MPTSTRSAKTKKQAKKAKLSAVVWKEGRFYVARGLEVELASQGKTSREALKNLREAFELWLENADTQEKRSLTKTSSPTLTQIAA